jgi:hypothetical protein
MHISLDDAGQKELRAKRREFKNGRELARGNSGPRGDHITE